jgi:hypothetical protein
MELVQGQLTSAELLSAVYSEATINCARVGVDVGKIEEFYIRYDTTTAAILMIIKE